MISPCSWFLHITPYLQIPEKEERIVHTIKCFSLCISVYLNLKFGLTVSPLTNSTTTDKTPNLIGLLSNDKLMFLFLFMLDCIKLREERNQQHLQRIVSLARSIMQRWGESDTHLSSLVMSTPMPGGAVMLVLIMDAKFFRINFKEAHPTDM